MVSQPGLRLPDFDIQSASFPPLLQVWSVVDLGRQNLSSSCQLFFVKACLHAVLLSLVQIR